MEYMCSDVVVDSSSCFSSTAWTDRHTDKFTDTTYHSTYASATITVTTSDKSPVLEGLPKPNRVWLLGVYTVAPRPLLTLCGKFM